jgi:hypothetical protein
MIIRHGDLLIKSIDKLPKNLIKKEDGVVAEGEHTNHKHRLVGGKAAVMEDLLLMKFITVSEPTTIVHEEHKALEIPVGDYEVIIEKEYDYFLDEIRQVKD